MTFSGFSRGTPPSQTGNGKPLASEKWPILGLRGQFGRQLSSGSRCSCKLKELKFMFDCAQSEVLQAYQPPMESCEGNRKVPFSVWIDRFADVTSLVFVISLQFVLACNVFLGVRPDLVPYVEPPRVVMLWVVGFSAPFFVLSTVMEALYPRFRNPFVFLRVGPH